MLRAIREIALDAILFVVLITYDVASRMRRLMGRTVRYTHARLVHEDIRKAEQQRDEALRQIRILHQRDWRARNILSALNDLQSRTIGDISKREFLETWRTAWSKPLSEPPTMTFEEIENARYFSDFEIEEAAAKIDPTAYYDDSIVIGSVVARRQRARDAAIKVLSQR